MIFGKDRVGAVLPSLFLTGDLGYCPIGPTRACVDQRDRTPNCRMDCVALVHALLQDVRGQDALPLLAFTLERLYRDHHSEGQLKLAHYQRLGGLSGALDAAVSDAFKEARTLRALPSTREALESLLRTAMIPHLCRINDVDEFARRVAHVEEIPIAARPL